MPYHYQLLLNQHKPLYINQKRAHNCQHLEQHTEVVAAAAAAAACAGGSYPQLSQRSLSFLEMLRESAT